MAIHSPTPLPGFGIASHPDEQGAEVTGSFLTDEELLIYGDKQENVREVLARLQAGTMGWAQGERILLTMVGNLEADVVEAGYGDDL